MKVTADDIAQLLASAPPRQVPGHVLGATRSQRARWGTAAFGLFFGLFSVPFMWVFFPWRIVDEWRVAGGETVAGVVSAVQDGRMRVNGQKIMKYAFTFAAVDGTSHAGACFAGEGRWSQGDKVMVRYLPAHPELALIEGARFNAAGMFGCFVIIFPSVGFGMVAWFVFQRIQAERLLRLGIAAEVDVLSVTTTNMQVNKQPVHAIVLSAPHLPAGNQLTIRRVNQAEIELAQRHAGLKQPAYVLYDPRRPKQMIFPEGLIGE